MVRTTRTVRAEYPNMQKGPAEAGPFLFDRESSIYSADSV